MRFRFFLLLPFIAAPAARANFAVAPVLNIVRKAPLFEKPSSRARMLGEADADTPVLGRRLSPQGSWLLVEDSDGNQGWIPTGRSNYSQVMQVGDQVLPGETEAPKPSRQDGGILPMSMPKDFDQDAPPSSPSRGAGGTWEVSAAYRTLITRSSTPGFPVGLSYLQAAGAQGAGIRAEIDLGRGHFPRAWRVGFLGRNAWVGGFFREVDVGFERQNADFSGSGFSGGYSLGVAFNRHVAFSLRGGLFWGSGRQWNGEMRCRFAF